MSELLRVALVTEGRTDAVMIEAALRALLPRSFLPTRLQPEERHRPELGSGWGGVLRWCLDFATRGYPRFEDDPTLPGFDLFVVHIDADVAAMNYADVSPEVAALASQLAWPTLPLVIPCPPPSGGADAMRMCLLAWSGLRAPGPRTVFCVPSQAIESWLAAAVLKDGHPLLAGLECTLNIDRQMAVLPKGQRIKKTLNEYRAHQHTVTKAWPTVRQRSSQAERFSADVARVSL
jgi:hypothetical protein